VKEKVPNGMLWMLFGILMQNFGYVPYILRTPGDKLETITMIMGDVAVRGSRMSLALPKTRLFSPARKSPQVESLMTVERLLL